MTRLAPGLVVVLMCSWLCPATGYAQDGDEAFKRGLTARDAKRWAEVVTQMRAAAQNDPKESTRKVGSGLSGAFGIRQFAGTEYMPHFLLGDALFELKDCAGAVEAWLVSEQQGVVRENRDFFNRLQSGLKTCASRGILLRAEFTQLQQATRQSYEDARALTERVLNNGNANKNLWQQGDFESEYSRGYRDLEAGFNLFNQASRSRLAADFKNAQAAIQRASSVLQPLELRFNAMVESVNTVQREARAVEQAIAVAEALDRSIDELKATLTPKLAASRQEAQAGVSRARERLGVGQRNASEAVVAEAAIQVTSASNVLQSVLDEARSLAREALAQQLADATAAATRAFTFIDSSFGTFDRLALERVSTMKPEMSVQRQALQKQTDGLRRRFERALKAEDLPGINQAIQLSSETAVALDALIKSFGTVSLRDRGVDSALESGARSFFSGEYEKTLDALNTMTGRTDVPLQLHVHLFKAAALYGLFVRSGETNQPLREQARAEIERCKQLDSAFVPDSRAFSPRFIAFYRTGSAERSDSAAANAQR